MSAVVDFPIKPEARPFIEAFRESDEEPQWLRDARRYSLGCFGRLGLPTRRSEDWRYINLEPLTRQALLPAAEARPTVPADLPSGVWLGSTARAVVERPELVRAPNTSNGQPFAALNGAYFSDGFVLDVAAGTIVDEPLWIVHAEGGSEHSFFSEQSLYSRNVIRLGAGSRVTVFETYVGREKYLRNDVSIWQIDEGAALTRVILIEEGAEAVHLGEVTATLAARAKLDAFALLLDGGTVRHEVKVTLAGDNASCRINGAYLISGREEANIVTSIEHAAIGGATTELIKGVAAGRAHGAFQGRIVVREGAQQTDARQTSRNLILGRRASIDTKPELEILADDVKCAHGASVGELDEAALFYLRTRGIPVEEARRLLVEGFLAEAIDGVADTAIREHLLRRLSLRLGQLEEWS
jgi:Fe-S cluster assembly protein SufD